MGVYKKENGKWYCRGQINGQRYHVLCKDATSKEKARLYEEELRLNIRNKQKGIVREEKSPCPWFDSESWQFFFTDFVIYNR